MPQKSDNNDTSHTFAFDVYGTLIDPCGVLTVLEKFCGKSAPQLATLWRDKQLEYSFRRAAMGTYKDFVVCTSQALDYACKVTDVELSPDHKQQLMEQYRRLPAFDEVGDALAGLRERGHRLYAFSNGHPDSLAALLSHAGLDKLLDGIVSVHAVRSFKPDPVVYEHFLTVSGASADECWLVSGNTFDILGARACKWQTAWVRRDPTAVFDPWDAEPTIVVNDLSILNMAI